MNNKLKAALIGGVSFGVASALPYLGMVNSFCCALYIAGGLLSAYLFLKDAPAQAKAPYGAGATVGLLAGLFGGVAAVIASMIARQLGYDPGAEATAMLEQYGLPIPDQDLEAGTWMQVFGGVMAIVMYAIFATVGGLVGVAIFRKKEAADND